MPVLVSCPLAVLEVVYHDKDNDDGSALLSSMTAKTLLRITDGNCADAGANADASRH
jgi:hypothetical protein